MFSIRKTIVSTLALAAFIAGGAALTAGTAAAKPFDREVGVTSINGGTDPHQIQHASDPGSSLSGASSVPNGTRINF